ncbi:MAG: TonB-dependent receptor plug domain-containing protein [Chromatiales bacterium]|nr:TonB-dependent receptor plug domain-containing protein [Chromatiales bacterium]
MTTFKSVTGISASAWMTFAVIQALPMVASAQIEEVVVSTRRREESLQDVPIAVSALTSEQIQQQGITDLKDIVANQPSVQFDQSYGPADNRITIRGLSNTRGRSNVAFLVDGIDTTTENLISAGSGLLANRRLLTDVERIEIVKGPQSALFGRSAFAGAISYITKEPTDEFDGRVSIDVGDAGRRTVDGAFGGPLSDTFGIRLTGVQYNEDGYYTNTITGKDVGGVNGYGGALTAVWKPADAVKVKARVEYSEDSYDPRAVVRLAGDTAYDLPPTAKAIVRPADFTGNPYIAQPAASSATNLFNFGAYCPGYDPANTVGDGSGAAFCLPGTIKDSSGYRVTLSENPVTGADYPGTDTQTFRASLIASFDLGYGLISSYTGWTDFDGLDIYDQDYQASVAADFNGNTGRPYTTSDPRGGRIDTLMGHQESNQDTSTKQFSQEFRYETQLDGPVQFTGGVLFWQEHRELDDRNNITFCAPYGRVNAQLLPDTNGDGIAPGVLDPTTGTLEYVPGICDGTNNTATSWQEYRRQVAYPQYASKWDARTRHLSFYGRVDWQMTDDLTLTLEDRFVDEEFTLSKPGSSSCTETAFATGNNATSGWPIEPRTYCDIERLVYNIGASQTLLDPATGNLTLRYIEGSTYSSYNTPKVTLALKATDSTNYFFSFGFGQKPGGINQLTGGGGAEPPPIRDERFDSEKLKAWELGVKTSFEGAGFWNLNSSIFLNDYTDKQVGIQVVSESGVSQPRIINIDGSRVWGFEFEALWQPAFMEGLTLSLAGTLLDAKITDWTDDTRNLVKAAVYGDCPVVYKLGDASTDDPTDELVSTDPNDPIFQNAAANPLAKAPVSFCRLDYSGNDLERSPEQSYSASLSIQRPFLDTPFEYLFEVSGSWQDERWADPENLVKLADYARMDLRLGLKSDKWDVIAYVDNVLDDDRFLTGGSGPDFGKQVTELGFTAGFGTTHYFATLPDPRVFGIRGSYRFGGGL